MANEKLMTRETAKEVVSGCIQKLENGQIIPSKSLVAKELETVSPESGDTQETPFASQGTGTANGTSSVDTGTVGKHIQKQGSVYCVNQLRTNGNFINTDDWSGIRTTLSASSNTLTATCNSDSSTAWGFIGTGTNIIKDHKYLIMFDFFHNIDLSKVAQFDITISSQYTFTAQKNTLTKISKIITASSSILTGYQIVVRYSNTSDIQVGTDYLQCKNAQLIDLTQWFNGNIPQDLLDHPEHWSWYQTYGDYIAYNTGTLVSGNGRYLVCGGRNVYNPNETYNCVIPNKQYHYKGASATTITYYDENKNSIDTESVSSGNTFTTPSNCFFINSSISNADIEIYYAGEDYSQYYPYEQPKVYDTGDEELLSTGVEINESGERTDAHDTKDPDGTWTHNVGIDSPHNRNAIKDTYYSDLLSLEAYDFAKIGSSFKNNNSWSKGNIICDKATFSRYQDRPPYSIIYNAIINTYLILFPSGTTQEQATTFINSLTFYYELATPTTEQGTPFSENIEINDFGTMGWYATYTDANTNALVNVPQGCKIFYPAWYVGFIDTLGQRDDIDWGASNVVSHSELSASETQRDNVDNILLENLKGMLRHQLSAYASIDFDNTKVVDLSNYEFINSVSYQNVYYVAISDIKNATGWSSVANVLCPLYKTTFANNLSNGVLDNAIAVTPSGNYLWIRDTSVGTAENLNKKLKGILLAYEKA